MNERRATLLGLAAVLCWSTVAAAFKLALRRLDPPQLLLIATATSLVVLFAVLAVQRRLPLILRSQRGQILRAAGLGVLNPAVYYLVLFEAYDRLPAQVAQPLNFTWALTLSWLSVPMLGHKLGRRDLVAGLVCYAGVVLIATGGRVADLQFDDPLGVALALGSTLLWSFYWLGNARLKLDPVVGLFWNFAVGLPLVLGATLLLSDLDIARAGLPAALYVGAVEMGFAFVLWLSALKATANASRIANLIFLAPFLSLLFIRFVADEPIRPATLGGLVLIVGGILWQRHGGSRSA
jgi:hypothetical protein